MVTGVYQAPHQSQAMVDVKSVLFPWTGTTCTASASGVSFNSEFAILNLLTISSSKLLYLWSRPHRFLILPQYRIDLGAHVSTISLVGPCNNGITPIGQRIDVGSLSSSLLQLQQYILRLPSYLVINVMDELTYILHEMITWFKALPRPLPLHP